MKLGKYMLWLLSFALAMTSHQAFAIRLADYVPADQVSIYLAADAEVFLNPNATLDDILTLMPSGSSIAGRIGMRRAALTLVQKSKKVADYIKVMEREKDITKEYKTEISKLMVETLPMISEFKPQPAHIEKLKKLVYSDADLVKVAEFGVDHAKTPQQFLAALANPFPSGPDSKAFDDGYAELKGKLVKKKLATFFSLKPTIADIHELTRNHSREVALSIEARKTGLYLVKTPADFSALIKMDVDNPFAAYKEALKKFSVDYLPDFSTASPTFGTSKYKPKVPTFRKTKKVEKPAEDEIEEKASPETSDRLEFDEVAGVKRNYVRVPLVGSKLEKSVPVVVVGKNPTEDFYVLKSEWDRFPKMLSHIEVYSGQVESTESESRYAEWESEPPLNKFPAKPRIRVYATQAMKDAVESDARLALVHAKISPAVGLYPCKPSLEKISQ